MPKVVGRVSAFLAVTFLVALRADARPGFTVATYNLRNLGPADGQERVDRLALAVAGGDDVPDLLAVQEVQDDDGTADTGTTTARLTFNRLAEALQRRTGRRWTWVSLDPVDGQDGGVPGGNIRVGFLWQTEGRVAFAPRGLGADLVAGVTSRGDLASPPRGVDDCGADARGLESDDPSRGLSPTECSRFAETPALVPNPALIDPRHPAFLGSRKPQVAEFTIAGLPSPLFVINGHLVARLDGGADKRVAQAQVVARFVRALLDGWPRAALLLLGDLNAEPGEEPVRELLAAGLHDLPARLPEAARATYVFEGRPLVLDHALGSDALATRVTFVKVGRLTPSPSDHAPLLVGFAADPSGRPPSACAYPRAPPPQPPLLPGFLLLVGAMATRAATRAAGRARSPRRPRPGSAAAVATPVLLWEHGQIVHRWMVHPPHASGASSCEGLSPRSAPFVSPRCWGSWCWAQPPVTATARMAPAPTGRRSRSARR
jgi:endonuclease/exonuclease/phosphatase family metal-dependent hydrolase